MTTIEKAMLIFLLVVLVTLGYAVSSTMDSIEEAGGVKQVIIDAGKEVKDISKQIQED